MKKIIPDEHSEQCDFIRWLRLQHPKVAAMTTAVPNGGHRHGAVAAKLKDEGVVAGYPDILIDYPVGGSNGLRIEMKRIKGSKCKEPHQLAWLDNLRKHGYSAAMCKGAIAASHAVTDYLSRGHCDEIYEHSEG